MIFRKKKALQNGPLKDFYTTLLMFSLYRTTDKPVYVT